MPFLFYFYLLKQGSANMWLYLLICDYFLLRFCKSMGDLDTTKQWRGDICGLFIQSLAFLYFIIQSHKLQHFQHQFWVQEMSNILENNKMMKNVIEKSLWTSFWRKVLWHKKSMFQTNTFLKTIIQIFAMQRWNLKPY